jgi:hypothetical protein
MGGYSIGAAEQTPDCSSRENAAAMPMLRRADATAFAAEKSSHGSASTRETLPGPDADFERIVGPVAAKGSRMVTAAEPFSQKVSGSAEM